jgi:hypothetical protein
VRVNEPFAVKATIESIGARPSRDIRVGLFDATQTVTPVGSGSWHVRMLARSHRISHTFKFTADTPGHVTLTLSAVSTSATRLRRVQIHVE